MPILINKYAYGIQGRTLGQDNVEDFRHALATLSGDGYVLRDVAVNDVTQMLRKIYEDQRNSAARLSQIMGRSLRMTEILEAARSSLTGVAMNDRQRTAHAILFSIFLGKIGLARVDDSPTVPTLELDLVPTMEQIINDDMIPNMYARRIYEAIDKHAKRFIKRKTDVLAKAEAVSKIASKTQVAVYFSEISYAYTDAIEEASREHYFDIQEVAGFNDAVRVCAYRLTHPTYSFLGGVETSDIDRMLEIANFAKAVDSYIVTNTTGALSTEPSLTQETRARIFFRAYSKYRSGDEAIETYKYITNTELINWFTVKSVSSSVNSFDTYVDIIIGPERPKNPLEVLFPIHRGERTFRGLVDDDGTRAVQDIYNIITDLVNPIDAMELNFDMMDANARKLRTSEPIQLVASQLVTQDIIWYAAWALASEMQYRKSGSSYYLMFSGRAAREEMKLRRWGITLKGDKVMSRDALEFIAAVLDDRKGTGLPVRTETIGMFLNMDSAKNKFIAFEEADSPIRPIGLAAAAGAAYDGESGDSISISAGPLEIYGNVAHRGQLMVVSPLVYMYNQFHTALITRYMTYALRDRAFGIEVATKFLNAAYNLFGTQVYSQLAANGALTNYGSSPADRMKMITGTVSLFVQIGDIYAPTIAEELNNILIDTEGFVKAIENQLIK